MLHGAYMPSKYNYMDMMSAGVTPVGATAAGGFNFIGQAYDISPTWEVPDPS
jgi:hypothetical protein